MRKVVGVSLLAMALISVSVLGLTSLSSLGVAAPPSDDAVIIMCGTRFDLTPPQIQVQAADSSANAPAIAPETSCAQALADLLHEGFEIVDSQADQGGGGAYTLVR